MATITLKNVPDELLQKIRSSAAANRRSMNSEILLCLESSYPTKTLAPEEIIERARRVRDQVKGPAATTQEIESAIAQGRP